MLCEGLRTSAPPELATRTGAGVGKPPVKEPAGCGHGLGSQALWGFGVWRGAVGGKAMRSDGMICGDDREFLARVLWLSGADLALRRQLRLNLGFAGEARAWFAVAGGEPAKSSNSFFGLR